MRLTNLDRDAIIQAVLNDVPMVDYKEQARVAIQRKAIDLLPPKLKALHKEFGHWFKTDSMWSLPGDIGRVYVVSLDDAETKRQMQQDAQFWQSIEKMAQQDTAQSSAREALKHKIRAAIYACTTIKQAHERMPEFAGYLPSLETPQDRSVPVIANLVADLTAAGWPKEKPKGRRKAA